MPTSPLTHSNLEHFKILLAAVLPNFSSATVQVLITAGAALVGASSVVSDTHSKHEKAVSGMHTELMLEVIPAPRLLRLISGCIAGLRQVWLREYRCHSQKKVTKS